MMHVFLTTVFPFGITLMLTNNTTEMHREISNAVAELGVNYNSGVQRMIVHFISRRKMLKHESSLSKLLSFSPKMLQR